MKPSDIVSVAELIKELGGPKAAGDFFGTTPQNVVNWRLAGKIPPRFYIRHKSILEAKGFRIPPSMWGMQDEAAA